MRRVAIAFVCAFAFVCSKPRPVQQDAPMLIRPPRGEGVIGEVRGGLPNGVHPLYIDPEKHNRRPEEIVEHPEVNPKRISGDPPKYPDVARRARIAGVVIVELLIERDGRVSAARILKPLPFGLDQAAIEAVRRWRYRPATQDGHPVRTIWREAIAIHPPQ